MAEDTRGRFRLIEGRGGERRVGHVAVVWRCDSGSVDRSVDAVVLEEDTWLTMSAPPEVVVPTEPLMRVMTDLLTWEPREPGSVIVSPGRPLRLLAVVHSFDEDPACRPEWVSSALDNILSPVGRPPLRNLDMPLLGTRHGGLGPETSLSLLREACERATDTPVVRLCLRLQDEVSPDLLKALGD